MLDVRLKWLGSLDPVVLHRILVDRSCIFLTAQPIKDNVIILS